MECEFERFLFFGRRRVYLLCVTSHWKRVGTYGIQIVDLHSGTTKLDVTPLEERSLLNGLVLFLKT